MAFQTNKKKCLNEGCNELLWYDEERGVLFCKKCKSEWTYEEYAHGKQPEKPTAPAAQVPAHSVKEKILKERRKRERHMKRRVTCKICDRPDLKERGLGCCGSCYPILKKFNNNVEKARQYRAEHPVKSRGSKRGASSKASRKMGIRIERAKAVSVKNALASVGGIETSGRDISIQFDLSIQIRNVKVVDSE